MCDPASPSPAVIRLVFCSLIILAASLLGRFASAASLRHSAIVEAVQQAEPSVVNIHGRKTVSDNTETHAMRQVNGMGTGVVIDERGYIITNYHVVEGVKRVQVSLWDGSTVIARLVAHDPVTDLAVVKIDSDKPLPTIRVGTSSDLMTGEEVVAIGNAYGYEHTVTRGIISALHRTVEVGEGQEYSDLIQTDASINPGNSGGPLLNIDGDMIGINVAVRVGAQGIGFAVPIDRAMEVAARLLNSEVQKTAHHGVSGQTLATPEKSEFVVTSIATGSGADQGGLQPGDVVVSVEDASIARALDFERALLGRNGGEELAVIVRRGGEPINLKVRLDHASRSDRGVSDAAWDVLGLRLVPMSDTAFRRLRSRYRGGLKVVGVRPESPAADQGIRYGDVLVGMHKWETATLDNVAYILESEAVNDADPLKFFILRGNETLFGHLRVSMRTP